MCHNGSTITDDMEVLYYEQNREPLGVNVQLIVERKTKY